MSSASGSDAAPPPVAATVHIYRGLMDRCYTWRVRVDMPTNWAVVTGGTVTSFVLGDSGISHAVLLLIMFFNVAFLLIEARRYRYYDLWASWIRLIETNFFGTALADNQTTLGEYWHRLLIGDMTYPHFKTSFLSAVSRRLRDNYMVIFLFVLFVWLLKLVIHPALQTNPLVLATFIRNAAVGPVPGGLVMSVVLIFYSVLGLLAAIHGEREPSAEVLSSSRVMQKLASPHQQPVDRRRWEPAEQGVPEPPGRVDGPLYLED